MPAPVVQTEAAAPAPSPVQPVKPARTKKRFRLLTGIHTQVVGYDEQKNPINKQYKGGDVVESEDDLVAIYNSPGSQRFQRVYREAEEEEAAARAGGKPADDGLEGLTLKQLQQLAEDQRLDLGGDVNVRSREAMIVAIRKARPA
jgi:hypothetical protein